MFFAGFLVARATIGLYEFDSWRLLLLVIIHEYFFLSEIINHFHDYQQYTGINLWLVGIYYIINWTICLWPESIVKGERIFCSF